jgi:hypothetical protein
VNESRICEIMDHLRKAENEGGTVSEHNWAAAKLIWEEVQAGTRQKDLAERIGKSQAHISRLKKCWQVFVVIPGVEYPSLRALGSFYEAYNSPEVHGESSRSNERNRRSDRGQGQGGRNKRSSEPDNDFSADGLARKMYEAASILSRNPAFWPLLTVDGQACVEAVPDLVSAIEW